MSHRTAYVWAFLVWPLVLCACFLFPKLFDSSPFKSGPVSSTTFDLAPDGSSLVLITHAANESELTVSALFGDRGLPVMGRVETLADRVKFVPAAPLIRSQRYRAEWLAEDGSPQKLEFEFRLTAQKPPTVRFEPQATLPANALKFYLHFSQPMEQGVFLERLKLQDADGKEVIGPFRETELWSPDGKRLTVWFHPGRQKTGVNLNEDEGPVLRPNMKHTLVIAGSWRSTSGVALGEDVRFDFQVGQADHDSPKVTRWQIQAPKVGTREPVQVEFDEALDLAMLTSALQVWRDGSALTLTVSNSGKQWSAVPQQPWTAGTYELRADPLLEDLAGNNLTQPFEVDLQAAPVAKAALMREFVIE
ncbi:MAG: Ig-like domain-containing protein [Prosthecobacter sp.]